MSDAQNDVAGLRGKTRQFDGDSVVSMVDVQETEPTRFVGDG